MWQNTHLTKTDHCKYLRKESLKNIPAAKKKKKKIEFKPTWSQSNATRSDAWQDFFIACWTTLFKVKNPHPVQTYHHEKESKTRHADIEFYRSQKHVSLTCNTYLFTSQLLISLKHWTLWFYFYLVGHSTVDSWPLPRCLRHKSGNY